MVRNPFRVEKNAAFSEGKSSASLHEDFWKIPPLKHKRTQLLKALLLIHHVTVVFHEKAVFTVKWAQVDRPLLVHSVHLVWLVGCCQFSRFCITMLHKAEKINYIWVHMTTYLIICCFTSLKLNN